MNQRSFVGVGRINHSTDAKMATWADELADEIKEVESSIAIGSSINDLQR